MNKRNIYEALSELARRVENRNGAEGEVKRLSREQYKANTLAEQQAEQTRRALELAQQTLEELKATQADQVCAARLALIEDLLPVLDGIEAGITSGVAQVRALMPNAPQAAHALAAWLDGQRLLRQRLLSLLAEEGVEPIPAKGSLFDPRQHVAVKVVQEPSRPDGQVVAVQRRGYRHGNDILRYAEVLVNRLESEE